MEQAPGLGVLTTDGALIVRSWNTWLESATGIAEDQARGRPLSELIPPERRDLYGEVLEDVLSTGATRVLAAVFHHYVFRCTSPSPHFEQMQQVVTIAPLLADAKVAGVMMTIEDVTRTLDEQRALASRLAAEPGRVVAGDALAAVGATDWRVRGAAVKALTQSATRDDIAQLLDTFERQHQDLNLLSGALQVLIASNRDVVPPLVALLADGHANLRMHAALALGELRDTAAVPALVGALDDADVNVRFHAIEALGRMAAVAAIEPLTRIAESGDFFLSFPAIDALATIDDPRVLPALLSLLEHELLRPAIVDAIAALGDEECIAPLVTLLNVSADPPAPVAAAITRIHERYDRLYGAGDHIVDLLRLHIADDGVRHLDAAVRRRDAPLAPLVTVLGWVGPAVLETLVDLVGHPDVEPQTAGALTTIGRAATMPLVGRLANGNRAARLAAASILGRLDDRRSVPALVELLNAPDTDLVIAAAGALAGVGDSRALDGLMPLFEHEHAAVRQAAIAAVNTLGDTTTARRIRERLTAADPRVRECAIRVAGYFGFEDCVTPVLEGLDDEDEDVRRAAIEQVAIIDPRHAAARLEQALKTETARNRAAAAHAARAVDDASLDTPLVAALRDSDPWVRYFAADALGQRHSKGATDALAHAAAFDEAPHVRIAAIRALSTVDADAALPVAERLLDESDEDIACSAIAALGRARSSRSDELLERASRSTSAARRECAVQALAARPTPASVATLSWAARLSDPPHLAAVAVASLASVATTGQDDVKRSAIGAMLDLAADPSCRTNVVDPLGRLPPDTIDILAEFMTDPRVSVRVASADALARMRHPRASSALTAALRDAEPAVRNTGVAGFGRLGTPGVAPAIAALRDADPDPAVRRRAGIVCERHGWER